MLRRLLAESKGLGHRRAKVIQTKNKKSIHKTEKERFTREPEQCE